MRFGRSRAQLLQGVRRWPAARWDLVAVVLAVLLVVLFALSPDDDLPPGAVARDLDLLAAGLLVAAAAVLVVGSRRFPLVTLGVVLAINGIWHELHYTNGVINATTMVAGFVVGATGDRRRQVIGQLLATIPLLVVVVVVEHQSYQQAIDGIGWMAVAILFGALVANRRIVIASYRQRAELAEAETRQAVTEERMRIARDLHDLLAHTISVVTVQSAVAAEALEQHPDRARRTLDTIRTSAKQATRELNATLAVLRDDQPAPHTPTPGLDQLPELAHSGHQRGLTIHTDIEPDARTESVPPLVSVTAYRVAQEALTNIARHAQATTAWLTVQHDHSELRLTVRDDGHAPIRADEGHGLRGMRERVHIAGGTLHHGPSADGGYTVTATFPLTTSSATT